MNTKTIFVTGATGFIGRHMCEMLKASGYNVIAPLRRHLHISEPLPSVSSFFATSLPSMQQAFQDFKIDAVIHLATHYERQSTAENIGEITYTNVTFAAQVLQCAIDAKVPLFIDTGSYMEYDYSVASELGNGIAEATPYKPANAYAATKTAFYLIAKTLCRNTSTSYTCLRLFSPYGPGDTSDKLIPSVINDLIDGREMAELKSPLNQLDFVYVEDVVAAYKAVLECYWTRPNDVNGRVFNIGSGDSYTLNRVVRNIWQKISPSTWKDYTVRQNQPPVNIRAEIGRAERILGWTPKVSLEEGLQRTVDWHLERAAGKTGR